MKNTFNTLAEVQKSELFKSGQFTRVIEYVDGRITGKYEIEVEDYGTPLCHQRSVSYGSFMDLTPSIH